MTTGLLCKRVNTVSGDFQHQHNTLADNKTDDIFVLNDPLERQSQIVTPQIELCMCTFLVDQTMVVMGNKWGYLCTMKDAKSFTSATSEVELGVRRDVPSDVLCITTTNDTLPHTQHD